MTRLIEYADAPPEVREVYDDIMRTRKTDYINNLWKAIAVDPITLKRTWEEVKTVMGRQGPLDSLTKELIYIAVSIANNCEYCIATHTAAARGKGMDDAMFGELMDVIALASKTNRLAIGYRVEVDAKFK
jgi:AhpD family alkylhydroperoxidase